MTAEQRRELLEILRSNEVSLMTGDQRPFLGGWEVMGPVDFSPSGELSVLLTSGLGGRLELRFRTDTVAEASGNPVWIAGVVQEVAATTSLRTDAQIEV
jgi:hypothetical protein